MGDIRRYMPQLVTGLPGQRSPVGVAMVEVSDGGCGYVDLPEHERALAAEARWSALEAVARAERDAAVSVSAELREQVSAREAMIARLHLDLSAKDAEIAELRELAAERSECADQAGDVAAEAIAAQRKAESERDEARECVRRLCAALQPFANTVPIEPTGLITGLMREDFSNAVSALAATPEHLR